MGYGDIIAATEAVACIFMLLILIATLRQYQNQNRSKRTRRFVFLLLAVIIGLCVDAFSYYIDGSMFDSVFIVVINALTFLITDICIGFFVLYLVALITEKRKMSYMRVYYVFAAIALSVACIVIGSCNGKFLSVNDGVVEFGPWIEFVSVLHLISVFYIFAVSFGSIKSLGGQYALLLSSYLIFPLISIIITFITDYLDFSYVANAISCCITFIFIQSEAITEARIREKVTADASKVKSLFLASMSHEIRTPINTILGMNEMILRESNENEVREYAMDIREAGQTLLSIIGDILDLSKIESGKLELVPAPYDVASMIFDVSNMIRFWSEEKGLWFEVNVSETIPSRLYGDDVRLRQVLMNMLTNAVKYTSSGNVRLKISAKQGADEGKEPTDRIVLHFEVEDTGQGLTPDEISKMYSEYERVLSSQSIEGTGLGMPITMKLLKLMGSELKIESEPGKGSVFSFDLEQPIVDRTPVGDFEKNIKNIMYSGNAFADSFTAPDAHILIVDDNAMNRKVLVSLLKPTEIGLVEAGGGEEAVKLASEQHFDLIIMDHMMPGMDGVEAMKRIKAAQDGPCADTPIIVLTANAVAGSREKYLNDGFDGYLSKPVDVGKLERIIKNRLPGDLIKAGHKVSQRTEQYSAGKADEEDFPMIFGLDWKIALMRLQDRKILDTVLKEFEITIAAQADKLQNFRNGLPDTFDDYRILVHGMKSSSASVGIIPLAGTAALLERAAADRDIDTIEKLHDIFIRECLDYKQKLKEYLYAGDENEDEKSEINNIILRTLLKMLSSAMEEMDISGADRIIKKMSTYKLPQSMEAEFENLRVAVAQLDQASVAQIISQLNEAVVNT